ncbi:TIGR03087 family PEP-CTERM/XrtA system glycosyltransferase [Parapedomonas caeni]
MDVLFLAHRIPYPPNKGDKIRSWHVLQHLAQRARVHLGCFIDNPDDMQHQDYLRSVVGGECCFVPVDPVKGKIRAVSALWNNESITTRFYPRSPMKAWAQRMVSEHNIRRIYLYSSAMVPFGLPLMRSGRRVVMDFIDMDSDKWRQYARSARWPMSRIYAREADLVFGLEQLGAHKADIALFVTEAEVASFKAVAGSAAHDVRALHNGVDHARFSPDGDFQPLDLPGAPRLVFTGAMDYLANVDAVSWFADDVLPLVRQSHPEATFTIVGARPTPKVQTLGKRPGITVTGTVDDVRPYIAAADIAVAPLRIARGVQNKVLEAMAMARTVVASAAAAQGINAEDGRHFIVADSAADMARVIGELAGDAPRRAAIGHDARALVLDQYDWGHCLATLDTMLDLDASTHETPDRVPVPIGGASA